MMIELHLSRYSTPRVDTYTDLHEAIDDAWGAVEFNMAAPVKLVVDGEPVAHSYAISHVRDDDSYDEAMPVSALLALIAQHEERRQLDSQIAEAIAPALPPVRRMGSRWA